MLVYGQINYGAALLATYATCYSLDHYYFVKYFRVSWSGVANY